MGLILITSIQNNHSSSIVPLLPLEARPHLRHFFPIDFDRSDKINKIFQNHHLPFLRQLIEGLFNTSPIHHNIDTIQKKEIFYQMVASLKYKKEGYFRRLFSNESWEEWTEHRTDLGKVLSAIEDLYGMEKAWKKLNPSVIKNSEQIAKNILNKIYHIPLELTNLALNKQSLSPTGKEDQFSKVATHPNSKKLLPRDILNSSPLQRRLTDFPISDWTLLNPQMPGCFWSVSIELNTKTLPSSSNFVYSQRTYTLAGASVINQDFRQVFNTIEMTISGFSPPIQMTQSISPYKKNDTFSILNPITLTIPKGYNGPIQIFLRCLTCGYYGAICLQSSLSIHPDLGPMPLPPVPTVQMINLKALINHLLNYNLAATLFLDPQQSPLTISLTLSTGEPLPAWLHLNGLTLSGIPHFSNMGNLSLLISAINDYDQSAYIPLHLQVVHLGPQINITIPNQKGAVLVPFYFILPKDAFFSPENTPLTYSVSLKNSTWLIFNPQTLTLSGTPQIQNVAILPIQIKAMDAYNASATNSFLLQIENMIPNLAHPIPDQMGIVSNPFIYAIPPNTFSTSANVSLQLVAEQINRNKLPPWLSFDARSHILLGIPTNTEIYQINITAINRYRQSVSNIFSIIIQPDPSDKSNFKNNLIIGSVILFFISILGRRKYKKILLRKMYANILHLTPPLPSLPIVTVDHLIYQLRRLIISIYSLPSLDQEDINLFFRDVITYFQAFPEKSLFEIPEIEELITDLTCKITNKIKTDQSNKTILTAGKLIKKFCELIILTEGIQSRKIREESKTTWKQKLNKISSKLNPINEPLIQLKCDIETSIEALKCIQSTGSIFIFLRRALSHFFSPTEVWKNLQLMLGDTPSNWYPLLLYMQILIPKAVEDLAVLKTIQNLITKQSDWRFFYQTIPILSEIATNTTSDEIRNQAINGSSDHPGLNFFTHFNQFKIHTERNKWIQEKARCSLK